MSEMRPRVYVVDDERIIAETLAMILEQSGFSARAFCDPVQALLAATQEAPDLLLTDVLMPKISGVDLAIGVLAACPGCKVVLFSGQADTVDLLSSARDRGHQFLLLSKPLDPRELLQHLRHQMQVGREEPPGGRRECGVGRFEGWPGGSMGAGETGRRSGTKRECRG